MQDAGATEPPITYQTVKLARGCHSSPEEGACVMELASMLAGEEFSDHPQSVCPVIGAFLRAYNDCVDDRWRHDLYAYAARVVGTRATTAVERGRADLCREAGRRVRARGGVPDEPSGSPRPPGQLRRWLQGYRPQLAARQAGLIFGQVEVGDGGVLKPDPERHRAALQLVDELIPEEDDVPDSMYPIATRELTARRKQAAPEIHDAFQAFSRQAFAEGALPEKTKQLIAVAVAHVTQCPYCIRGHTRLAHRKGASEQEIMEAIWVAAEMRAGGAYAHSVIALDALAPDRGEGGSDHGDRPHAAA